MGNFWPNRCSTAERPDRHSHRKEGAESNPDNIIHPWTLLTPPPPSTCPSTNQSPLPLLNPPPGPRPLPGAVAVETALPPPVAAGDRPLDDRVTERSPWKRRSLDEAEQLQGDLQATLI
ncbi:hypothetical protein WMY93_010017 [Mugilogobius chulae]|uniref:Uncharacterized protein n=1 Tax=Mugilogobius chulae TaxID=88201 RepID=A0AAW0PCG4_9GOBI